MYKACPYCKGIHPKGYVCHRKPSYKTQDRITSFRNTKQWQRKRAYIRDRDRHMCRLCAIGYGDQPVKYISDVSVHHIEPLAEAWEKRLDDDNLICLCSYHHELAEREEFDKELLKKLAISEVFSHSS